MPSAPPAAEIPAISGEGGWVPSAREARIWQLAERRARIAPRCSVALAASCAVLENPWSHPPEAILAAGLEVIAAVDPNLLRGETAIFLDTHNRYWAFLVFALREPEAAPHAAEHRHLLLEAMAASTLLRLLVGTSDL
ncbi:hypothetical protein [Arenibaculum pallidiluteum]|uniref:hypothetical protein n=1 Tax=Arenibaculum pallidiluteum TaxID=2812559 RepID=UPI001A964F5D|nr:hypothetical protein [Arenibaculum pallidiluteum]